MGAVLRPDARSIAPGRGAPQVRTRRYHRRMRPLLIALGALLGMAGLVWLAQGLNLPFAPASFMTADRSWVLIGAMTVVAGIVLIGWSRRRDPDP